MSMTKTELNQLYFLNKEVVQLQRELAELQQGGMSITTVQTGMPHASGVGDKVSKFVERKIMLEKKIEARLYEIQYERNRLEDYIASVEDSEIRLILRLRHVSGMSWNQIATEAGYVGANRESTVRKKYNAFLKVSDISE